MKASSVHAAVACWGSTVFRSARFAMAWFALAVPLGVCDAVADSVGSRLKQAADRSGGLVEVDRWTLDAMERPIWRARIGSGSPESGAVLLIAGLDGRHEVGVELALRHVESMADDSAQTRDLLRGRTLWVVPEMVPAGRVARNSQPARDRATAPGQSDSDRDGLVGEDRADDLDGDGVIRQVRVQDPDGSLIVAPSKSSLLHEAKAVKDEVGAWRLLMEGRDDDRDENWNEEEDGGVWLARNFPHGYEWFERGRGRHQVSEVETRAIADFLAAHPEIGAVWVYGFEDNLLTPWPKGKSSNPVLDGPRFGRDPITEPNEADLPWLRDLSERYRAVLSVPEKATAVGFRSSRVLAENEMPIPSPSEAAPGGLAQFVYFHRGRLALATPAWTPALQGAWNKAKEPRGEEQGDGDAPSDDGAETEEGGHPPGTDPAARAEEAAGVEDDGSADIEDPDDSEDLNKDIQAEEDFLAWLLVRDPDAWKPWTSIQHPDFPGQEAYVGGYAPGVRQNPPATELDSLAALHHAFLLDLFDLLPQVRLREIELRSLGKSVYELRFAVENIGWLPDVLAQGVYSAVVRPTRYELDLPQGADVLGGSSRAPLGQIEGRGGAVERTVLLRLPESTAVTLKIVSEFAGRDQRQIRAGEQWRVEP